MRVCGRLQLECVGADLAWLDDASLAVGDLDGSISIVKVAAGSDPVVSKSLRVHKNASIRTVTKVPNTDTLLTTSTSRTLCAVDLSTGKVNGRFKLEGKGIAAPHCAQPLMSGLLAVGDEDGSLLLVDWRAPKIAFSKVGLFSDYVAGVEDFAQNASELLLASGDGSLEVFDIRKADMVASCDNMEDEITCLAALDSAKSLLAACTEQGAINIFKYDFWGQPSDRIVLGEEESITCCTAGDSRLFFGTVDGKVGSMSGYKLGSSVELPAEVSKLSIGPRSLLAALADDRLLLVNTSTQRSQKAATGTILHGID